MNDPGPLTFVAIVLLVLVLVLVPVSVAALLIVARARIRRPRSFSDSLAHPVPTARRPRVRRLISKSVPRRLRHTTPPRCREDWSATGPSPVKVLHCRSREVSVTPRSVHGANRTAQAGAALKLPSV
jgi:hypothetical protein